MPVPPAMLNRFGAHLSVAGGLHRAFDAAVATGCDCMQIFVKNQRQWQARPLSAEQIRAFRAAGQQTGVAPVVAHASYLLNLASPRAAFARLVSDLRLAAVPKIIETPKGEDYRGRDLDRVNLRRLRSMIPGRVSSTRGAHR